VHNVGTSALTGSVKRDKGGKAGVGETTLERGTSVRDVTVMSASKRMAWVASGPPKWSDACTPEGEPHVT
jgi:hypothetical protein